MHPFDLPEPLSDKSTSVLLDPAVLHMSLVNHPGPIHELVIRSSHLVFIFSTNFPLLFHLQRVDHLLPVYCSGDMSPAIGSVISTLISKIIEPTPSHTDALSSSPSSSTSSIVGRKLYGAGPSTSAYTRRFHVRDDIIWWKIAADGELPMRGYDRSPKIWRPCYKPCYIICLLGIRRRLLCLLVRIRWCLPCLLLGICPRDPAAHPVSLSRDSTAPPVSPRRDPMAPPVSLPCNPMALPVFPARDPMARPVSPPRDPAAPPVSPPRDPAAVLVSPPRGPAMLPAFPVCVLVMPAAASAPAPVCRAKEPLFFPLIHLHPALREVIIDRQSTARPAVLLPPANTPSGAPADPSSRFLLPELFSALSPRSGAHAVYFHFIVRFRRHRQRLPLTRAPPHICAEPPLARRLYSYRISRFCCQLDSGFVSHLLRKKILCGDGS